MRRVVITGLGLVSSLGASADQVLCALRSGTTGFVMSQHMPYAVCPVTDEGQDEASVRLQSWRYRRYLSRAGRLAVLAGLRAVLSCGMPKEDAETCVIGTAAPALDFLEEKGLPPGDPLHLDALWLLRWLPNTSVSVLSILLNLHGEGLTVGSACASGLAALGEAWLRVRAGAADRVLVVCGDSRLSMGGLLGYAKAHTLSRCPDPQRALRPFDARRSGFVPGEGGAAFVVEEAASARARGARVLAEILGYGATLDGLSLTAPDPCGVQTERAVRRALESAEREPHDVAWISAHGTGTVANDSAEAAVIERVFAHCARRPRVTALKSWIGHGASAAGGLETALSLLAAREGVLFPVRCLEEPIADLPFVRTCTRDDSLKTSVGLVESFGFGGQNAALVLRVGNV